MPRALLVLLAALAAAGCDCGDPASLAASNQKLWDEKKSAQYHYQFTQSGSADPVGTWTLYVAGNAVTKATPAAGAPTVNPSDEPTIDDLFAEIIGADGRDVSVDATYEKTYGYPSAAVFSNGTQTSSFSVSNVVLFAQ